VNDGASRAETRRIGTILSGDVCIKRDAIAVRCNRGRESVIAAWSSRLRLDEAVAMPSTWSCIVRRLATSQKHRRFNLLVGTKKCGWQ